MNFDESVDRESGQKLYAQVYAIFKGKIEKGDWSPVSQIPPEDELCRTYAVSKATVRSAISELVRDGFLKRLQGKGTFVTSRAPDSGLAMRTMLTEDMFGGGVSVTREILERGIKEPPGDIRFHLRTGEDIYYIQCRRHAEGQAAYLEESFIPTAMIPGIETEEITDQPLYDFIQDKAVKKIVKVVQTVEITDIEWSAAKLLDLSPGSPVLLLHRSIIGAGGSPIAYTRLFGSGRKYRIRIELERMR